MWWKPGPAQTDSITRHIVYDGYSLSQTQEEAPPVKEPTISRTTRSSTSSVDAGRIRTRKIAALA